MSKRDYYETLGVPKNASEEEIKKSYLATLREAGCEPEDLEIGRADLEDVFLEIMNSAQATA